MAAASILPRSRGCGRRAAYLIRWERALHWGVSVIAYSVSVFSLASHHCSWCEAETAADGDPMRGELTY